MKTPREEIESLFRARWTETGIPALCLKVLRHVDRLIEELEDARETLDDYVDVRDGSDGTPSPNSAMSAVTRINHLTGKE